MSDRHLLSHPTYDPNRLLDSLLERMHLKSDAALARALDVTPPAISKMRHKRIPIGASILIRIHESTGLNVRELRELMGDRRRSLRIDDADKDDADQE